MFCTGFGDILTIFYVAEEFKLLEMKLAFSSVIVRYADRISCGTFPSCKCS